MKFPFKKVGDTFSVDEYNAMCYLLSKQDYSEDIVLETKAKHYKYGVYKLSDSTFSLITKADGYIIRKANNPITITIAHQNPTANFYVELRVAKQKEITENGITTILYPYDLIDKLENTISDSNYDVTYETIKLKATHIDDNTSKITFIPSELGLSTNDFINMKAKVQMLYNEPLINFADGRIVDAEQIICESFHDIRKAIISAPPESAIHLRLKGAKTYTFEDKIMIDNAKQVYIEGGNISSNSHSILDGQNLYRMFFVQKDCLLSVKNCKFYRGNATIVHNNSDIGKTGGAITMASGYENLGEVNGLHVSKVIVEDCIFQDCIAERGGAIYNHMGKLNINNCKFNNCKATSTTNPAGAFGGAVMNVSVPLYHGASNQITIEKSKYYHDNNGLSHIALKISPEQNINHFTSESFNLPEWQMRKGTYTSRSQGIQHDEGNQYSYNIPLPIQHEVGSKFYFTCPTSDGEVLCTRMLKITGNPNTQMYVEMV